MRRDPALQDLSRDHFVALNAVLDIRRVARADRFAKPEAVARQRFQELVQGVLPEHFHEEEATFQDVLAAPGREGHRERLRREHESLRGGFARVPGLDLAGLLRVAQELEAHIRWEEDDLFEAVQRWCTPEELAALGQRIASLRAAAGMPSGPARPL